MAVAAILSCLIVAASTQASDSDQTAESLWKQLLRGCDKEAAWKDIGRAVPMVTSEYVYKTMRDIYAKHFCSERELKSDLESVRRPNETTPPPAVAAAPTQRSPTLTCGPQLTEALMRSIESANPGASSVVKLGAVRLRLQLCGCLPPDPRPQNTDCFPLGNGFSCTTR